MCAYMYVQNETEIEFEQSKKQKKQKKKNSHFGSLAPTSKNKILDWNFFFYFIHFEYYIILFNS